MTQAEDPVHFLFAQSERD